MGLLFGDNSDKQHGLETTTYSAVNSGGESPKFAFLVDSTLWQWNFKYFALFELFYFILSFVFFLAFLLTLNIFSETMVRHWNISNNVTGGKLTNQVKCHNFRPFLEKWRHVLCISDVICQFSIFENLRGWQPWT